MSDILFSPYRLGDLELPNRVVMAPLTRCRATDDHIPTDIMATYYGERASAGLLISEGTAPHVNGVGYARIPGIYNEAQTEAWKPVTQAVHERGGRIAIQLMHTGRVSQRANMPAGAEVLAPSAIALPGQMRTASGPKPHTPPRAMTLDEVEEAIDSYVTASRNAMEAGFDMVELHGANGYLIEQFLSPDTNQREDKWGGSGAARIQFAIEVARRVSDEIGAGRLGIRLSPYGVFNGIKGWDGATEDFTALAKALGELELAYIHIVDHSDWGGPELPKGIKATIREAFGRAIILCGGYNREKAEADLRGDRTDLVAFGRLYIPNPDLVERLAAGGPFNTPDRSTFYTPGEEGYLGFSKLSD